MHSHGHLADELIYIEYFYIDLDRFRQADRIMKIHKSSTLKGNLPKLCNSDSRAGACLGPVQQGNF